jgi:processive 1,2-diacylglycerol beta-glucosyltransferase
MKALFLSAKVGEGHLSASDAIRQALQDLVPKLEALTINSYQYAGSFVGKFVEDSYVQIVKFIPQIYGMLYERREKAKEISGFRNWINQSTAPNFQKLVEDFKPDIIICTHAYPCGVASVLKENYELKTPVLAVVTDFEAHPFWVYPNLDSYAVASPETKKTLTARGIDPHKVKVTGIPIDPRFNLPSSKPALYKSLQLDAKLPVILIMGGGLGIGPIGKILKYLVKKFIYPAQIIVLTGKNNKLKNELEEKLEKYAYKYKYQNQIKVRILGFVNNVYEYMKAADLLITKSGGVTSSEALAAQLPMLIVRPIPGHEARNANYLLKKRCALYIEKEKDLLSVLEFLFSHPRRLEKMRENAKYLGQSDSALRVAKLILKMTGGQESTSLPDEENKHVLVSH